jgi:hypothetical protein
MGHSSSWGLARTGASEGRRWSGSSSYEWQADCQPRGVDEFVKWGQVADELMVRKQSRRYFAAAGRRKVIMKGYEFVPTAVLRQLSELHLPLSKEEYTQRLNELLRGAG